MGLRTWKTQVIGLLLVAAMTIPVFADVYPNTYLTLRGTASNFSGFTPDTMPDAFSFAPVSGAEPNAAVASGEITVTGINQDVLAVASGQGNPLLRVNGGTLTSSATVREGDKITLSLQTGAAEFETDYVARLTVGTGFADFLVTTRAADINPAPMTFNAVNGAARSTLVTSNTATVSGIEAPVPVTISGDGTPAFKINGGAAVTSGSVSNGDTVAIVLTTSASYSTPTTATIDVGGTLASFTVTTVSESVLITFASTAPTAATQDVAYSFDFKNRVTLSPTSVPKTSLTWDIPSGTLPAGLSLDSATGVVSGTPTGRGTSNITMRATYGSSTGSRTYTFTVNGVALFVSEVSTSLNATNILGHNCALTTGGAVACWGMNSAGQLGNGTTTQALYPVPVPELTSGVTSVSVGYGHACAVTSGGGVMCWGDNTYGQLGDGTTIAKSSPVAVRTSDADATPLSGVSKVELGREHSCALMSDGTARCWGNGADGRLGNNATSSSSSPVTVLLNSTTTLTGISDLSAGGRHSCALISGRIRCWGNGSDGALGTGTTSVSVASASPVTTGATYVSAGDIHSCAVVSGAARCWGNNGSGRLGDGTTMNRTAPVAVSTLTTGVTAITAGGAHTCAIQNGAGYCWGRYNEGQTGKGGIGTGADLTPQAVVNMSSGLSKLSIGSTHTCGIKTDNRLYCWGSNSSGQIGDNSTTNRTSPTGPI